jgi:hypothetical protein
MTSLIELRKIAEAARDEPYSDDILDCPAYNNFRMELNPAVVLELLTIIERKDEALKLVEQKTNLAEGAAVLLAHAIKSGDPAPELTTRISDLIQDIKAIRFSALKHSMENGSE